MARKPKLTDDDERLVIQLYEPTDGGVPLRLEDLAEKFEVSIETIRRLLKKHGIKACRLKRELL